MNPAVSPDHRSLELVRCLAAAPTLCGVLFLDLDPAFLPSIGQWLADAAATGGGPPPRILTLGSWHTEDDLWVSVRLVGDRLETAPGVLVEAPDESAPIVLVPNLATAGLAVQHAAVSLVGAEVASCERHGRTLMWSPKARWLVGCSREDAYRTSPHLLDRLPVRVDGTAFGACIAAQRPISAAIEGTDDENAALVRRLLGAIEPVRHHRPRVTAEALDRVMELSPPSAARRDIALARLGRAVAVRRGAVTVESEDVTTAAALLGLVAPPEPAVVQSPDEPPMEDVKLPEVPPPVQDTEATFYFEQSADPIVKVTVPALLRVASHSFEGLALPPALTDMYPEDEPDAVTEPAQLRVRWQRPSKPIPAARGQIIGTEQTGDLRDLAIVATLMEALKFQVFRPRPMGRKDTLVLSSADLRRYRRRPEPAAALLLVLDHTCHWDWDWSGALSPCLQWAYSERALVSVIEFGHRDTTMELRAERYRARSLLDPRITASLSRAPGRATPLASAIDLAVDELRHLIRRGRVPVSNVLLVLVSDGRGNVPFDASVRNTVTAAVGRRGVHDAVELARPVAGMREVRSIVLAPDLAPYPEIPFDLADALGGVVMTVSASSRAEMSFVKHYGRGAR
ncbi:hypothetical protein ABZ738_28055 [Micromonospora sp. NPDC047793]|uniref:hypothetical protein n=1 Tax=Micromonospora sp. NPDC047793 TaxID=3154342 RepID=UPI0033E942A4